MLSRPSREPSLRSQTTVSSILALSHAAIIDLGGATVTGELLVSDVTGPNVGSINSFERPDLVGVQERRRAVGGAALDYDFPAHSLSVLRMQVR